MHRSGVDYSYTYTHTKGAQKWCRHHACLLHTWIRPPNLAILFCTLQAQSAQMTASQPSSDNHHVEFAQMYILHNIHLLLMLQTYCTSQLIVTVQPTFSATSTLSTVCTGWSFNDTHSEVLKSTLDITLLLICSLTACTAPQLCCYWNCHDCRTTHCYLLHTAHIATHVHLSGYRGLPKYA